MFTRETALIELNSESMRIYRMPCDAEQIACFKDATRADEALAMLDDMEARLGFNPFTVSLAREALSCGSA